MCLMHGNIQYMFDYCADPVVQLVKVKVKVNSSLSKQI